MNGASGTLKIGDLGFATFRAGFSGAMSVIGTPEFMVSPFALIQDLRERAPPAAVRRSVA